MSQKQPGYKTAWIKLPAGTISSEQFRGLADLLEKNNLPGVRIAICRISYCRGFLPKNQS